VLLCGCSGRLKLKTLLFLVARLDSGVSQEVHGVLAHVAAADEPFVSLKDGVMSRVRFERRLLGFVRAGG
jgi:hypothetical protein